MEEYRNQSLSADIRQAKLGVLLFTIPLILFLYNDFYFFGLSSVFYWLAAVRFVSLSVSLLFLVYLDKFKVYRSYEYSMFAWVMASIVITVLINASRPENFLFHLIQVIMIIFVVYLVVPVRCVFKIIPTLLASIGESLLILNAQSLLSPVLFAVIFNLVLANVIGYSSSRLIESLRVSEFKAHKEVAISERKYRDFADSLPEIAFELNNKGELTFVNRKAIQILGYREGELNKTQAFQLVSPEDRPKVKEHIKKILQGQDFSGTEYVLLKKDGTRLPVLGFSERVINADGQAAIRGVMINLTEIKNAQKKLAVLNEKLSIVGKLTRHDVNNKLSAVTSYAFLIKKKCADQADVVDYSNKIEQAVRDSEKIFGFAKMYEQLGVEELKYVDVEKAINEAVALFDDLNLKLISNCHGLSLFADSFLRQLFYNFVDNTRKHGGKATTVRVYYEKTDHDTLELIYEDDGLGISKESKLRLFTEGFSTGGSTGYGLFLSKKMIDVYGWSIKETGEPGQGVRFTITVPMTNRTGQINYQVQQ